MAQESPEKTPDGKEWNWFKSGPGIALIIFILGGLVTLITTLFSRPEIKFSVKPVEVKQGERITLEWEVKRARHVEILPEIGTVDLVGGRTALADKSKTYTLIATGYLLSQKASYQVTVKPNINVQRFKIGKITFAQFRNNLFLLGQEFVGDGIQSIRAAPEGDYCREARPAILQAGSYNAPYSFLSTAKPGSPLICNTVKLEIFFTRPMKQVHLRFYGADSPYELEGFRQDNTLIGTTTKNAKPYDYRDYEIALASPIANIGWIRFGYETSLTMVRDIEFIP